MATILSRWSRRSMAPRPGAGPALLEAAGSSSTRWWPGAPSRPAFSIADRFRRRRGQQLLRSAHGGDARRTIPPQRRALYPAAGPRPGLFPGGLLTAPSDAGLRRDIELAKELGFNGARQHQKVEDPRWLYWADRLGFLVWGEMANFHEYSQRAERRLVAEWRAVVERDRDHPSIVTWVPENESFGGLQAVDDATRSDLLLELYDLTRRLEGTRPVVSNDGERHAKTDLCLLHDYSAPELLARRYPASRSRSTRTRDAPNLPICPATAIAESRSSSTSSAASNSPTPEGGPTARRRDRRSLLKLTAPRSRRCSTPARSRGSATHS